MAFIALGVTGGIGAYKAVEIARGLQKQRPRRRRDHDAVGAAVRRPADVRGDHAARGDHRPVEARRQRRHRAHRHRLEHRPAAGRAGHRQHDRQVRATASPTTSCRRSTSRRAAPVLIAPAMNTQHVRAPGGGRGICETLRRRGVHFVEPGAGYLACGWIGKGRLAEPEDVVASRASSCCGRRRDDARRPHACWSRPGRPTRTSIRCASSATARAAGWASRWPPKRCAAARR